MSYLTYTTPATALQPATAPQPESATSPTPVLQTENLSVAYGTHEVLHNITLEVQANNILALIGPSGCGKSTLLRTFNRMNDFAPDVSYTGACRFEGEDVFSMNTHLLRSRVGMVFQRPNPFPMSIRENILFGPRHLGLLAADKNVRSVRAQEDELVESCLTRAGLWDDVKDKLGASGTGLSGGQQQRLCIARALASEPAVLLMDEPTSALDPLATSVIEELMAELAQDHTVVVVTHNMQQAARVATHTAFFYMGDLVECAPTRDFFANPQHKTTVEYLSGRFS